jgi:hypothetical protein
VHEQGGDAGARLARVARDPGGERRHPHDVGLVREAEHDPAAHRVTDEGDGDAGVHLADAVQRPAGVAQGVLGGAVPAADAVLQAEHCDVVACSAADHRSEGHHPQDRESTPGDGVGSSLGAAVDDEGEALGVRRGMTAQLGAVTALG